MEVVNRPSVDAKAILGVPHLLEAHPPVETERRAIVGEHLEVDPHPMLIGLDRATVQLGVPGADA